MNQSVHRYWKYAAIILALALVGSEFDNWKIKKKLAGVFHYNIVVTAIDATTERPLDHIAIQAPGISSSDLFQQTYRTVAGHDGTVGISGIAYEPRRWSFWRDGYTVASIIIDQDTEPSLTVKLEPIKEEQQAVDGNPD